MCVAGPKVFNGQHQNISGHYPSFLRKIQIWARANNEKKKQAVHLYCLQYKQNIMYIYINKDGNPPTKSARHVEANVNT
jgi:hypothetical protein